MPDSPTSQTESNFVCDCEEWMRSACAGEPFYKEHEGKRYCVLHFPSKDKSADFKQSLQRKLENKDFDFRGLWFPDKPPFENFNFRSEANFSSATFSDGAHFRKATFFNEARFNDAIFSAKAHFGSATFAAAAYFHSANFAAAASFYGTTFNAEANFSGAIFGGGVEFMHCSLRGKASFSSVIFRDYVDFSGMKWPEPTFTDTSSLCLLFARIEKPEHFSFRTLSLRPHWFVHVDARRFEFRTVKWQFNTKQEIKDLITTHFWLDAEAYELLGIACRQLAVNAEENHRYEESSKFRYMAMEARRLERWRGFAPWRLGWWYWLASGYGERVLKAFVVLLGIWFVAGLFYTQVGFARWEPKLASEADAVVAKRDDVGAPLKFSRALTYSAGVMTFQKPEPKPATTAAQTIVLFETVLGPVQAALLALAIRRKFMR